MRYSVETPTKADHQEIVEVWEQSVRATHHFLKEADIQYFKPLIVHTYLDAVDLRCVRNTQNEIIGFSGVAQQQLEMLFIHPKAREQGVGKALLIYCIEEQHVNKVDVNEDNQQAIGFYEKFGFKIYDRSELDPSGKPHPILHMQLD
jgi:putative acetyltransferase